MSAPVSLLLWCQSWYARPRRCKAGQSVTVPIPGYVHMNSFQLREECRGTDALSLNMHCTAHSCCSGKMSAPRTTCGQTFHLRRCQTALLACLPHCPVVLNTRACAGTLVVLSNLMVCQSRLCQPCDDRSFNATKGCHGVQQVGILLHQSPAACCGGCCRHR